MTYFERGGANDRLSNEDLRDGLYTALGRLGARRRVAAVPPDMSRYHSRAGFLTGKIYEYYGDSLGLVLPAIGTHTPLTDAQKAAMYPEVPKELFAVHSWRNDLATLGTVPESVIEELSEGALRFPWPAQMNRRLVEDEYDLILSVGQVVPHEVIGMANYNKNLFIGTGGRDGINKSHYLSAVYGMERIMGRADTPVRRLLNYAEEQFARELPIVYVLTVIAMEEDGSLATKGLFIGDDSDCFRKAAALSAEVNVTLLDSPVNKVVAYLDPSEFKSTWIGNKSVYRTRMAIADGGELVVLAPGVGEFGEDEGNDRIIRKYGYVNTEEVLRLVKENEDLQQSLGAAAHLIHGATEGRFRVTYCPGHLSREEIESVGYEYADPTEMQKRYDPAVLSEGLNTMPDGEVIYFTSNPALGLWAAREQFRQD